LRASQQQYQTVVDDQSELICRFLPDGTLTFVNGACCRAAGRSAKELVGTSFWSLVPGEHHHAERESLAARSTRKPP
jgi:PAS domain S-box-containing protein